MLMVHRENTQTCRKGLEDHLGSHYTEEGHSCSVSFSVCGYVCTPVLTCTCVSPVNGALVLKASVLHVQIVSPDSFTEHHDQDFLVSKLVPHNSLEGCVRCGQTRYDACNPAATINSSALNLLVAQSL